MLNLSFIEKGYNVVVTSNKKEKKKKAKVEKDSEWKGTSKASRLTLSRMYEVIGDHPL